MVKKQLKSKRKLGLKNGKIEENAMKLKHWAFNVLTYGQKHIQKIII